MKRTENMYVVKKEPKQIYIQIKNNPLFNETTITLPDNYWNSHFTIQTAEEPKKLRVVKLPKNERKKVNPPRHNSWEISQGDYRVKEKYREMTYYRELKQKLLKVLLLFSLVSTGIIVYWISSFISRV